MATKNKNAYAARALALHKKLGGKLSVVSKAKLQTREDWSTLYTPGVGAVSSYLAEHPEKAREYTMRKNTVAVISDGTAVLGLGNIGPIPALPVMEGKAVIFKEMGDIDAIPLVLDEKDPKKIVDIIKALAPTFGGINLEDFAAPHCFDIEAALVEALDIPVMHDDQHGTAIVVLAGLMNAAKVVKKKMTQMRVVIVGAGAAGTAIAKLLLAAGLTNVTVADSKSPLNTKRADLTGYKKELAKTTNPEKLATLSADAIVFALANPIPEIMPDEALKAGARIVATGRSDFPNKINNALAFPGVFRGVLDVRAKDITEKMKIAAAHAIAGCVENPSEEMIIPNALDREVA